VLVLNMIDESDRLGVRIDAGKLVLLRRSRGGDLFRDRGRHP
jgi:hypothetical protein